MGLDVWLKGLIAVYFVLDNIKNSDLSIKLKVVFIKEVMVDGIDNEGISDIVGAVGGETSLDPSCLGEIEVNGNFAVVEVEENKVERLVDELDGSKVGSSNVNVSQIQDSDRKKIRSIRNYIVEKNRLVEMERKEEMREHEKSIRNLSGKERQNKGKTILHLSGKDRGESLEGYKVKFMRNRKGEKLPETEISVSDLVMLSKKDPLRDDNPTGTVIQKTNYSITVAFKEKPPSFLYGKNIRMDLYVNDITYQRMKDAINKMIGSDFNSDLRDIIIGIQSPKERGKTDIEKWFNEELNYSQRKAVARALESEDFHLIHGPPGTGKTTTAIEVIEQAISRGKKVLVTADSNIAVDNILDFLLNEGVNAVRVGHPARVTPKLRKNTLDSLIRDLNEYKESQKAREKAFSLKEKQENYTHPSGRYRRGMSDKKIKNLAEENKGSRGVSPKKIKEMAKWIKLNEEIDKLFEKSDKLRDKAVKKVLENSDVICTTNSTAGTELIEQMDFDILVIDEATQATEPSCLIPITHANKVIMAGDHKQLPPTVKNPKAKKEGLTETLFEKLACKHPYTKDLLETQYRMNEEIMKFPSKEFYNGKLKPHPSVKNHTLKDLDLELERIEKTLRKLLNPENPTIFLDTSNLNAPERTRKDSTSKENPKEAKIAKNITEEYIKAKINQENIAIIAPYDDQVDLIDRKLNYDDLEIKTVDGFQGREKEIIVISLTRSNESNEIGFLKDLRRLNVSLTRSKRKLIVIGDSSTLRKNRTYKRLIDYIKNQNGYYRI
ncbi:MAG: Superfamily I DNA/RNA helicase [Candidatus Methanohalarchaeum thermophilum]|uniref:DNA helicase n=1 Tax=Methanohalarchaeum thermophilum TaxID=1903181 RepID=A0A1Q6DX49_METT1|nr:MAG: Superfamily I DNA/RNA helicase [Candidatus Methanohalarchaeum thermophilum]